jgi:hypothetical protein
MMVTASELLVAADRMKDEAILANGVRVTRAQMQKAAEILRDGPQPFCNGIGSEMPGFIGAPPKGKSLVLQVGILPSRAYRIDKLGRARPV